MSAPMSSQGLSAIAETAAPASRPLRDGLLQTDPPRLLGSACRACSTRLFPARDFCPACGSDDVEGGVPLATAGTVYSFTVVRQAPPGRETPYSLAYIDLADGVRVMAQVTGDPDALRIDMPVQLDIRPVGRRDGCDLIGYVFVPSLLPEAA
ncbi:Zn-ribbon domain-containing OB-fold protein [Azospirillum sp. YIM DDC1]|uniref:Zn-ribbon domain-containing OB-fold protein n=1 Tax=Azospirillum aestuarii TaxID=2802052 RepID=A0ABS1I1W0_9PROT|nr:Zn-ribbon domain-containing OB-fold protein [Azospirillum aestuarii]MBK4720911.1 Zn-ribbon domain-containing OB-fold protein [Azospirillum aestuarii]TWA78282.1 putative OB-fold protein [Azospirillum brasilense]